MPLNTDIVEGEDSACDYNDAFSPVRAASGFRTILYFATHVHRPRQCFSERYYVSVLDLLRWGNSTHLQFLECNSLSSTHAAQQAPPQRRLWQESCPGFPSTLSWYCQQPRISCHNDTPKPCLGIFQAQQFTGNNHMLAARQVLCYLRGTWNQTVCYSRDSHENPNVLWGWVNADWAGDTDTRRSHTGYILMMNGGPISWKCRRQDNVSLSTSEAEFVAASLVRQEAIYLR